jgi:VanZ family protein
VGDASAVLLDGRLLLGGSFVVLAGVAGAPAIARRLRISRPHATALVLATGMIVATTLTNRSSGWFDVARLVRWEPWRWYEFNRLDYLMNIALFAPAAAFWTAAARRPALVLGAAVLTSVLIEYTQGVFRLGTGDQADVVSNALGALIGVVIGWWWARSHPSTDAPAGWTHRQLGWAIGGTAAGVALSLVAIGAEADRRAEEVSGLVDEIVGGATTDDLASVWSLDDRDAVAHFNTAYGYEADAITRLDGGHRVVVRYPIDFFGAKRCVYLVVDDAGTDIVTDRGDRCRDAAPPISRTAARRAPASAPPAR